MPEGDRLNILSICVLTYNREHDIDNTLEYLAEEIVGIEDMVEICISDNCSSDDTQKVVEKWKAKIPLVYGRNETNLGFDRNVLAATMLANGTYVWYMGDDDEVTKGAVKKLVLDLSKNDSPDMKAVYVNGVSKKGKWMAVCNFKGFKVFKKEQVEVRPVISFLGCICVRRDEAINVIRKIEIRDGMLFKKDYNNYLLHNFAHSYMFFECLKNSQYIGIAADYGAIPVAAFRRDKMSYRQQLYYEVLTAEYILEIRKYYPWLKEAELMTVSSLRVVKRTYINSCLVMDDKGVEHLYIAYLKVLRKILKDEGRVLEFRILNVYVTLCVAISKIPALRNCLMLPFLYIKNSLPYEKKETIYSEILSKNESYALKRLGELIDG